MMIYSTIFESKSRLKLLHNIHFISDLSNYEHVYVHVYVTLWKINAQKYTMK